MRAGVQTGAYHLVVGVQGGLEHPRTGAALFFPVGQSASDRAIGVPVGGDALVSAAVCQGGEHMVEHHPVGDPPPVTPPRMRGNSVRSSSLSSAENWTTGVRSGVLAARARTSR